MTRTGSITRKGFALAATILAVLAGSSAVMADAAVQPDARPNIVVIMTDDQNVSSLAVMFNVKALLANAGTTFANSFVAYSLCCPSRATYLTGQYPHNHGVMSNNPPDGGYYLFPAIPGCKDEEQLVIQLLNHGVLVHPGYFYSYEHGAHLMLSCLTEPARLVQGLERLSEGIAASLGQT